MTYQDHANALRRAADASEDAQRALNHLDGVLDAWDELDDHEKRMGILDAMQRLDGSWRNSLVNA